jgi:electron transfer flavoprotein alpha subunit
LKILAITEQRQGKWHPASWENLAAAQQIARETQATVVGVVMGHGIAALADELADQRLEEVLLLEHDLLEPYTADAFAAALAQVISAAHADLVLFPHTYQVRDFAPKLAASFDRCLIADCIGCRSEGHRLVFVRPMFQGKAAAEVTFVGAGPWFASFQAGAFRADAVAARPAGKAAVRTICAVLKPEQIRMKALEVFRETKQAVDLSQAQVIVAIGRGIKAQENIALAEHLAHVLGGELAASRPICDEGWLPMERQVGSSGQTVAPKLYLALGISGAIQHVVGMKGSRTVVAINRDQNAPIFEVADYGIVGDIFEIMPALAEALEKAQAG